MTDRLDRLEAAATELVGWKTRIFATDVEIRAADELIDAAPAILAVARAAREVVLRKCDVDRTWCCSHAESTPCPFADLSDALDRLNQEGE